MAKAVTKKPYSTVALVLFLGATAIALGTSTALPGLNGFHWTEDARAGRELIGWFAQLSGASSDILPIGILFVLPVFAARWVVPRPGTRRHKDPEKAWEERQRRPTFARGVMQLSQELGLVLVISVLMGALLASYLAAYVLPESVLTPSFVPSAILAIVSASVIYFLLIGAIDGLNIVDGMAALTFCGGAATFGKALASLLPAGALAFGNIDPGSARALLWSAIALPIVIALLRADCTFEVTSVSRATRRQIKSPMLFRLIQEQTLRLAIGLFLWTATTTMVAAAAIGHFDVSMHEFDWLLFPAQPILIALVFYWLAVRTLDTDTYIIANQLRLGSHYLPGVRPGAATERALQFSFRRIYFAGAFFAGAISALVAGVFWFNGSSALESLQGLAWVWTIGAAAVALLRGVEARTERLTTLASLMPRIRWTPAQAQFTLLCVAAFIDRELAPEEKVEAMALGARTRTLHETASATLHRWFRDVEAVKNQHAGLMALANRAIDDFPDDIDMRRAVYAQCADIAHADRSMKDNERAFLRHLAKEFRLGAADRDLIDAVLRSKNRH